MKDIRAISRSLECGDEVLFDKKYGKLTKAKPSVHK